MAKSQYLDLTGLTKYDELIKGLIGVDKIPSTATQKTVVEYLVAQISGSEFSGKAEDVTLTAITGLTATDVQDAIEELLTSIKTLNGGATETGSVAKAIADAMGELKIGSTTYTTAKAYMDALAVGIKNLIDASTGDISALTTDVKTDLVHAINDVNSKVKAVDYSGKADKVASATAGNFAGLDAQGNLTDSGKKAADFVLSTAVGTAAAKNVKTTAIADADSETATVDENLVTASQVAAYVKTKTSSVTGALHFKGIKTATSDVTSPAEGDVVIVGTKEYIYDGSKWDELGDEGTWVAKTTTIAGVDLQDNITAAELKTAIDVDDLETTVGNSTKGLVKDVSDLQGLVGEGYTSIPVASITALF